MELYEKLLKDALLGPETKVFSRLNDEGRRLVNSLEGLEKRGLIEISRKAIGMITYSLTESGKSLAETF